MEFAAFTAILLFFGMLGYFLFRKVYKDIHFKASVFSQINNPVVMLNQQNQIVYWNKEAEDLYEYKTRDILNEPFEILIPKEHRKEDFQEIQKGFLKTGKWHEEQIHLTKRGEKINVDLSAKIIKNTVGDEAVKLILIRDITARKKAEHRQKFLTEADVKILSSLDMETILKKIASHCVPYLADACVIDIIEDSSLTLIAAVHKNIKKSGAIQEFHDEVLLDKKSPMSAYKIVNHQEAVIFPAFPAKLSRFFGNNQNYHKVLKSLHITSLMIVPLVVRAKTVGTLTFMSAESGKKFDDYTLDLAESLANRVSIAIDNAQLYLGAQEAIKTREEFLSLASHELKTPLTSLLLQLQIVLKSIAEDPLAKLSIERMLYLLKNAERQSKKLASLITNLLNVSRITGGRLRLQPEGANLKDIVIKVVEDFQEQLDQEKIKLSIMSVEDIRGNWDILQLEQVITNLISNSIKYGEGKPIEIYVKKENSTARLAVKDYGIGIDPKEKVDIFKPFSRAAKDSEQQGLGVGLFIVKQIVEAHKGKIDLVSTEGKGSTFTVDLPTEDKS